MEQRFPRSEIIQNLSILISSIDCMIQPQHGNYDICSQAKRMLQTILDTVLTESDQRVNEEGAGESFQRVNSIVETAIDDQLWLENGFDMDFWTNLEEHPLLAWPGENSESELRN